MAKDIVELWTDLSLMVFFPGSDTPTTSDETLEQKCQVDHVAHQDAQDEIAADEAAFRNHILSMRNGTGAYKGMNTEAKFNALLDLLLSAGD